MKKLLLTIALIACCLNSLMAQSCLPEGITFTTQSQIDSFQINYPGCTEIEGHVTIAESIITNLDSLCVLTSIAGWLTIGGTPPSGTQLDNLVGLNNLTHINGSLRISFNDALLSLSGLNNLSIIEGGAWIWGNESLINMTGMDNLNSIGDGLDILSNNSLNNLEGFDNLAFIEGNLSVTGNNALTSFDGLTNLTSIEGMLWIIENEVLTNLTGLINLEAESLEGLSIFDNTSLPVCHIQSICDYLAAPNGDIEIHDNAPGCNSTEEVEAACEAVYVADIIPHPEFSIYPNPATKEVFISTNNDLIIKEVNIYNQVGQKIIHKNFLPNMIDVSMLQEGMYVIEVVTNDIKIREKLIIK